MAPYKKKDVKLSSGTAIVASAL